MQAQLIRSHCNLNSNLCRGPRVLEARHVSRPHTARFSRAVCGSSRESLHRIASHGSSAAIPSRPAPPPLSLGCGTVPGVCPDSSVCRTASPTQPSERQRVVCRTARLVPALTDGGDPAQSSPLQGAAPCAGPQQGQPRHSPGRALLSRTTRGSGAAERSGFTPGAWQRACGACLPRAAPACSSHEYFRA